ncbi:MAG TPA: glycosyltransferase [Rubrobacter sp.]|nr:glycosyltransferase [Rubrobacter sp.]
MKIGYVLKRYPRYSETFVVNEILAHEAAGLEVEIFALRPPSDTHFQDIISRVRAPVNYLSVSGIKAADFWTALGGAAVSSPGLWTALREAGSEDARDVYQAALLAREARLKGITHLHAHFATASTSVARLAAKFARIPYTFTTHAKDIFHESVCPEDFRRKLEDAAGVVTVSDYNLRYLRETYGPAAERTRRVYNGLDLQRFTYKAPLHRLPKIVAVGRLVEKKGFADLIGACATLAAGGRQFTCEIVGSGELEADLRGRIEQSGAGGMIRLIGPRPQAEVVRLVQEAAAFVAPCVLGEDGNRDGLPTALLEAMALGTPVVSTDVTGIPEVLRDGETGLLVPQRNPAEIAGAISRLTGDSTLRIRLADRARRLIEADFNVQGNAAYLRDIFAQSAESSRKAVPA